MRMQLALSKIRGASYHSKHHLRFVCVCVCLVSEETQSNMFGLSTSQSERLECGMRWYSSKCACAPFSCSVWTAAIHLTWPVLSDCHIWAQTHTHARTQISTDRPFFFPDSLCFFFSLFFPADEREDVQKKTFTKWVNSQLAKVRRLPVSFPPLFAASSVPCLSSPPSPTGPSDHTLQSLPLAVSARFCRDEFSARGGVSGGGERQRDTTLSP